MLHAVEKKGKKVQSRGAAMRARLLAAAAKVFAAQGYSATTVADISKAAGTSYGNFYWHFANKDEALLAVLEPSIDALLEATPARARGAEKIDVYAGMLFDSFLVYKQQRKLIRVMREAAARGSSGTFFEVWMRVRRRFIVRTLDWLRFLEESGLLLDGIDLEEAAEAEIALIEQLAYTRIGLPDRPPGDDEIRRMARQAAMIWHRGVIRSE